MTYDVVIIGGGFFGCAVALHMRRRGLERIALVEREAMLLSRASYCNQARVHNGYHYPRSLVTAYRSRVNLPRFCRDYGFAVKTDFVSLYAVAERRSKIIPAQFERFMREIGAKYETAGSSYRSLFDDSRTAGVYVTEEYAFDARRLRDYFARELAVAAVDVLLNTEAARFVANGATTRIELRAPEENRSIDARTTYNCSYARINCNVARDETLTPVKHEITEIALIDPPQELQNLAITVMDGPFFSCMPFPAEGCHSLTHVRYTPHGHFTDTDGARDPLRELNPAGRQSRVHYMIADAARLVPCLRAARWRRSLFEIKTVLLRNEADDGRPVLLRRDSAWPGMYSLLGGKIDNIYDILARLDALPAEPGKVSPLSAVS